MSLEFGFSFPLLNGLHARPASFLQNNAKKYKASIRMVNERNGNNADVKSTISLMSSNTMHNDRCKLIISGEDEAEALVFFTDYLTHEFALVDENPDEAANKAPGVQEVKNALPRFLSGYGGKLFIGFAVASGVSYARVRQLNSAIWSQLSDVPALPDEAASMVGAIGKVRHQLNTQVNEAKDKHVTGIINAHLSLLEDPEFLEHLTNNISFYNLNCAKALETCYLHYKKILSGSENLYLRQRVVDIQDLTLQILNVIYGKLIDNSIKLTEPTIIIAEELTPSQFLGLDRELLKGLVLLSASATSHTAILARSFGIPTVSDLIDADFMDADQVILDGKRGIVIPNPTEEMVRYYQVEIDEYQSIINRNLANASIEAKTIDGKKIQIAANVASSDEVAAAVKSGATGVGLFRSEFIFMDRSDAPTEEEQYQIYAKAAENGKGHAVIVRTLDIGGDKPLEYLNLGKEANPFLGYRAVRFYKEHWNLIRPQLRALLRAGVHGNLWIMVPMISNKQEIAWLRGEIELLEKELEKEGVRYKASMPLGIMVEVPSIAFAIEDIAQVADFFSIGTNDLCQYFFASERGNNQVSHLADPNYPAFIRLLRHIVSRANKTGKFIGMCGEMAGNIKYLPLLVGLGLEELSMSAPSVAAIKCQLTKLRYTDCLALVDKACACQAPVEIEDLLQAFSVSVEQSLITENIVFTGVDAIDKTEVIKTMASALYLDGRITDVDKIDEALWVREDSYSTGIGFGIATPHCRTSQVTSNSICVLQLKNPIEWGAMDNKPVRIVIGIVIKEGSDGGNEHLKIIAKLARKLVDENFRSQLLTISNRIELRNLVSQVIE